MAGNPYEDRGKYPDGPPVPIAATSITDKVKKLLGAKVNLRGVEQVGPPSPKLNTVPWQAPTTIDPEAQKRAEQANQFLNKQIELKPTTTVTDKSPVPVVGANNMAVVAQPENKAPTPIAPAAAKIATATSTSNEETNPLRQARLANGSMSEAPPSVYKDLGASNADLIKNAAPGQESRTTIATSGSKAVGFMPDGRDKFETNYAVRGDNGGSGTVKFSGPSQRVGGGTVSVMDQGNGGTAEGNVAAMERQYQALRSQREAMNPGITTGTGAFIPSAAEPVDPFSRPTDGNGDAAGRRSQYEGLIKSANDSGLTAKQRATRLAAAEAMIAPGQEAAKLQNASAMNEADNATRDRATAAQRMNSQLDAESQAAQRSQAQRNADRQAGLQADNQKFQQEKDVAQFAYKIGEDAKSRGDTAYKEVQADTERYYKDSGDSKGNGRVNPSELLVFGDQLFGSKDAKLIEDKYPGLSARIANRTPRYNDYHLLKAMRDSYNKTDGWFTSPSMEEATNRFLSGK